MEVLDGKVLYLFRLNKIVLLIVKKMYKTIVFLLYWDVQQQKTEEIRVFWRK